MSRLFPGLDHRRGLVPLSEQDADAPGWDDQQVQITQAIGGSGLGVITYRDTGVSVLAFAVNDVITVVTQLPHRWNRGTVRPHIHVIPHVAPAAPRVLRFSGKYAWATTSAPLPANVGWTAFGPIDTPIVPGDEFTEKIIGLALITPPADALESAILVLQLTRPVGGDTYNDGAPSNLVALSVDTHFQAEKAGTYDEFPTP